MSPSPRAPPHAGAHDPPAGSRAHRHAHDRLTISFRTHCSRARRARHSPHNPHLPLQHKLWPSHSTTGPLARHAAFTNPWTRTTRKGSRGCSSQHHARHTQPQTTTPNSSASCTHSCTNQSSRSHTRQRAPQAQPAHPPSHANHSHILLSNTATRPNTNLSVRDEGGGEDDMPAACCCACCCAACCARCCA